MVLKWRVSAHHSKPLSFWTRHLSMPRVAVKLATVVISAAQWETSRFTIHVAPSRVSLYTMVSSPKATYASEKVYRLASLSSAAKIPYATIAQPISCTKHCVITWVRRLNSAAHLSNRSVCVSILPVHVHSPHQISLILMSKLIVGSVLI